VKEIPLPFPEIGFEVKEWISLVLERKWKQEWS
jgi:hypothetical protein